jgi:hypothetical protein
MSRKPRSTKYQVNHHAFDKLTLTSCYWAGYIAADGCIKDKSNTYPNFQLNFHVNRRDRRQLSLIKCFLQANNPIYHYNDGSCELSINQLNHLANVLRVRFNITTRKSLTLMPPLITNNFALAFIVGYIDGDGCIRKDKYKHNILHLRGTQEVLKWICMIFDKLDSGNHYCTSKPRLHDGYWSYTISGHRAIRILNQLKSLDIPKMPRKWNKVKNEQ